jgi:hypothetical protein
VTESAAALTRQQKRSFVFVLRASACTFFFCANAILGTTGKKGDENTEQEKKEQKVDVVER